MPTGRKPKPTNLKLLHGTSNPERINKDEPQPGLAKSPKPPAWLNRKAKVLWRKLAPLLEELGLLTSIYLEMFAAWCQCFTRYREAEEVIEREGSTYTDDKGNIKRRPETIVAKEQLMLAKALAAEFGMTPSSITKLKASGEDIDEAERFLFGAK